MIWLLLVLPSLQCLRSKLVRIGRMQMQGDIVSLKCRDFYSQPVENWTNDLTRYFRLTLITVVNYKICQRTKLVWDAILPLQSLAD